MISIFVIPIKPGNVQIYIKLRFSEAVVKYFSRTKNIAMWSENKKNEKNLKKMIDLFAKQKELFKVFF